VKFYDTLGRLIGDINRSVDSFHTPYVYIKRADTIFRQRYDQHKTELLHFERFVYNSKGQILSYLDCANYYFKSDSYYAGYDEFYYDEQSRLKTKLHYFNEEYPGKVSDTIDIKPAQLQLNDVIYFSYKKLKTGNKLIIGKHAIGEPDRRAIDSFLYDNKNRLLRFNSFVKIGVIGELVRNNLNNITDYRYKGDSLTISTYYTYCQVPLANSDCLAFYTMDKEITLIIYNKDGTKKETYGFYIGGEKYLTDKYEYGCY